MTDRPGTSTTLPATSHPGGEDLWAAKGTVIAGKYRVEKELGAGGMGVVLEARHETLDELVAIKMLRGSAARDPEATARFIREARAARRLKGQHTVRVHDVGTTAEGVAYIVMERLVGDDLAKVLLARGRLPIEESVGLVLQACEALAEAHALGVIHRDLKPSNLFLTQAPDGTPLLKVLDFGIAKAAESGDAALTETGSAFGSPLYMPPEQIRSAKHADARSDVWGIGVVLYELLAGRPPFDGETAAAVIASVMTDRPAALVSHRPEISSALGAAVEACLEKASARRTPSVLALARSIAPFGPPGSDLFVSRIERLATRTTAGAVSEALTTGAVAERPLGTTSEAAISMRDALPRRSARPLVVIAGIVALAGIAALVFATRSATRAPERGAEPGAPEGSANAALAARAANAPPVVAPPASSTASAPSPPAPPAILAPAPAPPPSTRARPRASAIPYASPSAPVSADPLESKAATDRR